MGPIKAVSLTASQHKHFLHVSASVGDHDDDRRYSFRMEWVIDSPPSVYQTTTDWLCAVLSRVVENFDDHDVTDVKVEGVERMWEGDKDA